MFGKPGDNQPSRLVVEHFKPEDNVHTTILKHVSIDRNSLRAREGALYASEYIAPCSKFKGRIILDLRGLDKKTASKMLELLLLSLLELEDLGLGRGSRTVTVTKVKLSPGIETLEDEGVLSNLSKKLLHVLNNRDKPCIR